ncbi:hypothetical protein ANN_08764 [Periplaneta americana]|uniref:Uncharacterized protein n=1 Tax=Periplaneta americana TaxID=6978 RepID=A0ABQ8T311_PERAM|nr:hypothetical protein ANN_08764 [Periplaneta americana]
MNIGANSENNYQWTVEDFIIANRASTSSSLDRVCAVINNAFALLETDFREVLRQQLRQGYLSGYLAYSVLHTSIQQGRLDSEQARLMF